MQENNKSLQKTIKEAVEQGIIDAIGDAVSIHDTDFRILYQNTKAKEIIGSHIGEYCYKAYENSDDICKECPLALTLKDGRVRTVERHNPVITELIVEITTSAIKDSKGSIIGGIEVVRNITERKKLEKERERLVEELRNTLDKVRTLRGLLPICSSCSKIRDDKGNWTHVDVYIRDHSEADITHGLCPECEKKHFPGNFSNE
jgi:PAS domain S-box-containing protein